MRSLRCGSRRAIHARMAARALTHIGRARGGGAEECGAPSMRAVNVQAAMAGALALFFLGGGCVCVFSALPKLTLHKTTH